MKDPRQKPRSPGITLRDILFAIYKHKWLILFCSALGIGGGIAVFLNQKPIFESRAKLMVQYVVERNPTDGHEAVISTGGGRGVGVMQAEIAILTSWDLLMDTANAIGAERLIPESDQKVVAANAAAHIMANMEVTAQRGGNVLNVTHAHEDPELAREVLVKLVEIYFKKHLEIHRGGGGGLDLVSQQADLVGTALRRAEDDLQKKKQEANVISLAEATASVEAQRAKISVDLLEAKVALRAQAERLRAYEKLLGIAPKAEGDADGENPAAPEAAVAKEAAPDARKAAVPAPALAPGMHVLTRYRTITSQLSYLEKRQFELEMKFRGGTLLDLNRREIARLNAELAKITKEHPGLIGNARVGQIAVAGGPAGPAGPEGPDLVSLRADLAALQARSDMLEEQELLVQKRFDKLARTASEISSLESKRAVEMQNYQNSQTSLGKARIDEALDATRIPNIKFIQTPSTPAKTYRGAGTKIAAGISLLGVMLGLGIALLLELVVDHRVKHPVELESRFRIPLMMSIPRISMQERHKALAIANGLGSGSGGALATAPLEHGSHFINPYADAVRDRLGYYFELNNMTHKPKLIALAGLSEGAGTTTLAAGLAAAFAEIDDSTVLFLDMNSFQNGEGESEGKTDANSLKDALVPNRDFKLKNAGGNLYVATMPTSAGSGSKRLATKKFYDLMPKFRASNFDYIIFDMPTLGSTSPTSAMTGFMDQVILVLDAQNTDRDLLQQGYADLARGNADVTCVFNKTRSQAPRWIQGAA